MPADLQKARELFLHAVGKLPAEQWENFIVAECGADAELAQQVRRFLQVHRDAGSFLETPAAAMAAPIDELVHEIPGTTIGPYKLLEQIGEGGFGVVYMAEQTEPVRRKVALKILKPGMDTRQVVARFEAERQALAIMDHPNIAKVFDGGATPSGRPYFVMELVKGVPITEFCDQNHLTPRQRLELFLSVCQAVQHAHQKAIIHRDLKPSNVLVSRHDATPVVKVIDFGVAKALGQELTDKTLFTGFAQMVGTPLYMSPEQAGASDLDIDTRSDIYSLGVLLYELLTGTTPFTKERFKQAAYEEIRRIIREEDPPKPSTRLSDSKDSLPSISAQRQTEPAKLTKLVRGELDWIVMKALEKDRNRRYETANGFAMDVQRYLADEPVLACPPSMGYRFRKFARRNRGKVLTAAVLAVASLVAVSAISWAVRDRAARQEEQAARQVRVTGQVQLILDEVAQLQREQKWPEALDAARRASDLVARGDVETEIAKRVQNTVADLELVRKLEDIRADTSEWKEGSFDYRGAAERYAAAFRDCGIDLNRVVPEEAAQGVRSRSAVLAALVPALDDWAHCRRVVGDERGAANLRRTAALVDPDHWRNKVRQAVVSRDVKALLALEAASDVDQQSAATLCDLGSALKGIGQPDEAIRLLSLAQRLHPADYWVHFGLAQALRLTEPRNREREAGCYRAALALRPRSTAAWNNLGIVLHDQRKLDEAGACFNMAIKIDARFARGHNGLGSTLSRQGKLDEAIACHRKSIELDPKDASAYSNLGLALAGQGKVDEAIAWHHKAIEVDPRHANTHLCLGSMLCDHLRDYANAAVCFRKTIELDPKNAVAYCHLGNALSGQKQLPQAIAAYHKAIELDPKYAAAYNSLGRILCDDLRQYGKGVECFRKAIEINPIFRYYYNLGNALRGQKKSDEAIAAYHKAIELNPQSAPAYNNLGSALYDQQKLDEASAAFHKAIELDPKHANAFIGLGNVLSDQKKWDEAVATYRKAVEADPKNSKAHHGLGSALIRLKKHDEAMVASRRAIELDPNDAALYVNLGLALRGQKKWDEAIAAYHKAIELHPKYANAYNCLGTIQCDDLREYGKAVECFRKAIELDPTFDYYSNLGNALRGQGKVDDAIAAYRKAIELHPKNFAVHFQMGILLCDRKQDYDGAIAAFRKVISLEPKANAWTYYNLGLALRLKGDGKEAIASFREAIRLQPTHGPAHANLARCWTTCSDLELRKPQDALEAAKKGVELVPQSGLAWLVLGWANYRNGEWKNCIAALEKSMSLSKGGDSGHWFFLAMAHGQLGHNDEARRWYDRAVAAMDKYAPRDAELQRIRAEAEEVLKIKKN